MKNLSLFSSLLCITLLGGCADKDPSMTTTAAETDAASSGTETATSGSTPTTSGTSSETGEEPTSSAGSSTGSEEIVNCDPWEQDCPDGYKCMAYADEGQDFFQGTKCTPVAENPGQAGDVCHADGGWSTGIDDCALGHACWNINPETSVGACVPLCTGTMDAYSCPDAKDICVFWIPGIAHVCLESCDPLLQDCPADQSCGPNWASGGQEFVCYLDYSFEEGQEFDPCNSTNSCDPGLICSDPVEAIECESDSYCCLPYCDLSDPATCNGEGATCESFYEPGTAPPEHADVGFCGLPG